MLILTWVESAFQVSIARQNWSFLSWLIHNMSQQQAVISTEICRSLFIDVGHICWHYRLATNVYACAYETSVTLFRTVKTENLCKLAFVPLEDKNRLRQILIKINLRFSSEYHLRNISILSLVKKKNKIRLFLILIF